jgi:hypothetical protein
MLPYGSRVLSMAERMSGESMWMIITIVLILVIMFVVFALLSGLGPGGIFDLFQGIMSAIAMYLVSQLHVILR